MSQIDMTVNGVVDELAREGLRDALSNAITRTLKVPPLAPWGREVFAYPPVPSDLPASANDEEDEPTWTDLAMRVAIYYTVLRERGVPKSAALHLAEVFQRDLMRHIGVEDE